MSATLEDRARPRTRPRTPSGLPRRPRPSRLGTLAQYQGLLLLAVVAAVAALAFLLVPRFISAQFAASALPADGLVSAAEMRQLAFTIRGDREAVAEAHWKLDGKDVSAAVARDGDRATYWPSELGDGPHELEVVTGSIVTLKKTRHTWRFTVDTTPPAIAVAANRLTGDVGKSYVLSGSVEAGTRLEIDGELQSATGGEFVVRYASPPGEPIVLTATDAAGNTMTRFVTVQIAPRPSRPPIRGMHVTAIAWKVDFLREPILDLIDRGLVTTIQIDLKDEGGWVGYDSEIPLARKIGAVRADYDLDEFVALMREKGVRVVGRIVAFRDPVYAGWAWRTGRRDHVVQTPGGGAFAGYGGFTNFAHPAVQRYNVAIAEEAAKRGVEDILWDYVRRPDGPLDTMRFPRIGKRTPEEAVVDFLARSKQRLARYDTFQGASVFGVAATRPGDVAQDVAMMAAELDYIAPMLYPSHWGKGEYDVENPNADPYQIVLRSLRDFRTALDGKGVRLVPWLQAFSYDGITYGPREVQAQIEAAQQLGVNEWLLWDPLCTYSDGIFPRDATRTG